MATSKEMLEAGMDPIEAYRRVIEQAESGPPNRRSTMFRPAVCAAAKVVLNLLEPGLADTWDPDDYRTMLGAAMNVTLDLERLAAGELSKEELASAATPPTDGPPRVH